MKFRHAFAAMLSLLASSLAVAPAQAQTATPTLEYVMTYKAILEPPLAIDSSLLIVNVLPGGWIKGPNIRGTFLAPGADWLRVMPSGVLKLDVRAVMKTDDGDLLYFTYAGLLQHTEELVRAYPPAQNRHGSSHWPVMRVVVAHDNALSTLAPVMSGLAVRPWWGPMYGPHAVSEQDLAKLVMKWLTECSVFLGDRNFGVYSMAYTAQENKHLVLFRLTGARAKKLHGGALPKAGTERAVRWAPSRDDLRTNPEIPATAYVDGRLPACKVREKNGQWTILYPFTTLDLPMDRILEL